MRRQKGGPYVQIGEMVLKAGESGGGSLDCGPEQRVVVGEEGEEDAEEERCCYWRRYQHPW